MKFNFGDGPVDAHKHPNGGGWVADTTQVAATAYVGPDARVCGEARVSGNAQVSGKAQVSEEAWVTGKAHRAAGGSAGPEARGRPDPG